MTASDPDRLYNLASTALSREFYGVALRLIKEDITDKNKGLTELLKGDIDANYVQIQKQVQELAYSFQLKGAIYAKIGDDSHAIDNYLNSLQLFLSIRGASINDISLTISMIAKSLIHAGNLDLALEYSTWNERFLSEIWSRFQGERDETIIGNQFFEVYMILSHIYKEKGSVYYILLIL